MSAEAGAGLADVVVVGAGAAGLATAIFLARRAPRARVEQLESARRRGAKILVSGGGRCNVTNRTVGAADFWQPASGHVRTLLRALPVADTVAFFRGLGVALRAEEHGKLFPTAGRARGVLDALLAETARRGVDLRCAALVSDVRRDEAGFRVVSSAGEWTARRVVLASGGRSLPRSGSDGFGYELARRLGHTLVEPVPALVPLVLADGPAARLLDLSRPAHDLLADLAAGRPLGEAVAAALARGGRPWPEPDVLFGWFRQWVAAGVFRSVDID